MNSFENILKEIIEVSGLSEEEIRQKIEEKQVELSGLISPEGAAYIVAKELGIDLIKGALERRLKIKNILPGLKSVDVCGRIIKISKVKEFEKNGKSKGVLNIVLGDETGVIRLSLWDEEIENFKKLNLDVGDVISIKNGYSKESSIGGVELRVGKFGKIFKTDLAMPTVEEIKSNFEIVKFKDLSNVNEEEYIEVKASLVQVFKKNLFFEVCPKCEARLEKMDNFWKCAEHGVVEPKYNLVISGIIDDGFGNLRIVFFRELAEIILGVKTEDVKTIIINNSLSNVYEKIPLGKDFIIRGRLKRNIISDHLELIADYVEEAKTSEEIHKILKKIDKIKN